MEPIYQQEFTVSDAYVDCFGRLKPSMILYFAQEVAGQHFARLSMDYESLAERGMFWAVSRHKVELVRLPLRGETVRVETWPMPTTRVAYPRSVVAYDAQGQECFRAISLWVLMDLDKRSMVLPGKSGIDVCGTLRGYELATPGSLPAKPLSNSRTRTVCFTDLDRNGHMNNTRYLDWIDDLHSSQFHAANELQDITLCYLSEAREGQTLQLQWDFPESEIMQVDIHRDTDGRDERVFSARLTFGK